MSENPTTGTGAGTTRVVYTGDKPNPIFTLIQRPRIMLLLLAGWSLLSVLSQAFTRTDLLVNNGHNKIHGLFGGLAFGWEGIPLAPSTSTVSAIPCTTAQSSGSPSYTWAR
jgi:hypothetical protein